MFHIVSLHQEPQISVQQQNNMNWIMIRHLSSHQSVRRISQQHTLGTGLRYFSDDGPKVKQSKVKKKSKKATGEVGGRDKILDLVLSALDAPMIDAPPPTEEEAKERFTIGKNYVIGMFNRHNENAHDLSCKIAMKQHAIKMLPRNTELKKAALVIDTDRPPMWREIPMDTPPIPGFDPTQFLEVEGEE